jgi:hypothetical protein
MFHNIIFLFLAVLGLSSADVIKPVKPINTVPLKPTTKPKIGSPLLGKIPGEVIMPEKFGNSSRADLKTGAYPCGTVMASYNGIEAYSNGDYQGTGDSCGGWSSTGLQFQCVEYTQRYFNYLYGVAPVWPVDYASQMCDSHPAGVCAVGYPSPGFGVVFGWGGYGHTAVVIGVGSSTIDVIEQNGSPYGTNSYWQSDVWCYLAPC